MMNAKKWAEAFNSAITEAQDEGYNKAIEETQVKIAEARKQGAEEAIGKLDADSVQWVVNDNSELGVKIGNRFFFLYKGDSLEYEEGTHDDGTPMQWRLVGKREFGECCHPVHLSRYPEIYTEGVGWQPLPNHKARGAEPACTCNHPPRPHLVTAINVIIDRIEVKEKS